MLYASAQLVRIIQESACFVNGARWLNLTDRAGRPGSRQKPARRGPVLRDRLRYPAVFAASAASTAAMRWLRVGWEYSSFTRRGEGARSA